MLHIKNTQSPQGHKIFSSNKGPSMQHIKMQHAIIFILFYITHNFNVIMFFVEDKWRK